jgi:hypothetical protein
MKVPGNVDVEGRKEGKGEKMLVLFNTLHT